MMNVAELTGCVVGRASCPSASAFAPGSTPRSLGVNIITFTPRTPPPTLL